MIAIQDIRTLCTGRIALGEPLAPLTSFRIGGPADLYVEPMNEAELRALIGYFDDRRLPWVILGNGSNVLVHDDGYRGAAMNLGAGFSSIAIQDHEVSAGAGCRLATFVATCVNAGLRGVERLAGIPGTLGGALVMNAGAHGGEISDHLMDVRVLRNGTLMTLPVSECGFVYRGSALGEDIVLGARFALEAGNAEEMKELRRSLIDKRNATQPLGRPNAGSVFKNPVGAFAGQLIEHCGLKGLRRGAAAVSDLHANFIVNLGGATAEEVTSLMKDVRRVVFDRMGVRLEPELRFIGYHGSPLGFLPGEEETT